MKNEEENVPNMEDILGLELQGFFHLENEHIPFWNACASFSILNSS